MRTWMTKCAFCKVIILSGGKSVRGLVFCELKCARNQKASLNPISQESSKAVSEELVMKKTEEIYRGSCPRCLQMNGHVELYESYFVTSYLIVTTWNSESLISCKSCSTIARFNAIIYCIVFGWWGVPYGLFMTPIQIARNFAGILITPARGIPSLKLQEAVKAILIEQEAAQLSVVNVYKAAEAYNAKNRRPKKNQQKTS